MTSSQKKNLQTAQWPSAMKPAPEGFASIALIMGVVPGSARERNCNPNNGTRYWGNLDNNQIAIKVASKKINKENSKRQQPIANNPKGSPSADLSDSGQWTRTTPVLSTAHAHWDSNPLRSCRPKQVIHLLSKSTHTQTIVRCKACFIEQCCCFYSPVLTKPVMVHS